MSETPTVTAELLDSSIWIEILCDGPERPQLAPLLSRPGSIIVPTIVIAEVTRFLLRWDQPRIAGEFRASLYATRVVNLDRSIAAGAARLGLEFALPLADSIILATAEAHAATLWTMDAHFEQVPRVRYIRPSKRIT